MSEDLPKKSDLLIDEIKLDVPTPKTSEEITKEPYSRNEKHIPMNNPKTGKPAKDWGQDLS